MEQLLSLPKHELQEIVIQALQAAHAAQQRPTTPGVGPGYQGPQGVPGNLAGGAWGPQGPPDQRMNPQLLQQQVGGQMTWGAPGGLPVTSVAPGQQVLPPGQGGLGGSVRQHQLQEIVAQILQRAHAAQQSPATPGVGPGHQGPQGVPGSFAGGAWGPQGPPDQRMNPQLLQQQVGGQMTWGAPGGFPVTSMAPGQQVVPPGQGGLGGSVRHHQLQEIVAQILQPAHAAQQSPATPGVGSGYQGLQGVPGNFAGGAWGPQGSPDQRMNPQLLQQQVGGQMTWGAPGGLLVPGQQVVPPGLGGSGESVWQQQLPSLVAPLQQGVAQSQLPHQGQAGPSGSRVGACPQQHARGPPSLYSTIVRLATHLH
eukprot:jgi/Botrbrau1/125/Bobra.0022s0111.1